MTEARDSLSVDTDADGIVTATKGLAPTVLAADCVPIVVAAPGAVATLHAGWRGLEAGVIANGVGAIRALVGDAQLTAAIGPAAGACCYEVGLELHERFPGFSAGPNLDLKAIAQRPTCGGRRRHGPRHRHLHDLLESGAVLLIPPRRSEHGPPGGDRVVDLIHGLTADDVRANLAVVHERLEQAGRKPGEVQILAAVKYLPSEELGALAAGGITLVGENRAQDLIAKAAGPPGLHLGLHRLAAESQGGDAAAARPLHPLGRDRLGAGPARQARRRRPRASWSRSTSQVTRARRASHRRISRGSSSAAR